jgi:hypothetical protein
MGIDNIQLSGYLCQNLYNKSLIGEKHADNTVKTSEKFKINVLGQNKSQVLFLVNNRDQKFVSDSEMKLLSNLLSACKLSMADISLVNFQENPGIIYTDLIDYFHPKKILIFGISTSELQLPFTIPFFQIQQFHEQLYLTNPSLNQFLNNKELKIQLWNCLKKLFPEK